MPKVSLDKKIIFSINLSIALVFNCSAVFGLDNPNYQKLSDSGNQMEIEESPLQIEHVTDVDENNEDDEVNEDEIDPETNEQDEAEKNSSRQSDQINVKNENQESEEEIREPEIGSDEKDVEETPVEVEEPVKLEPPRVPKSKSKKEAESLKLVVRELQYGSLLNSISLLERMVKAYPYDPDYKELLSAARNLRHADIWYQYQRRLQLPPPSAKPKVIYKLIKMRRNEKPINELKQAGWFQLIKNRGRLEKTQ